MAWEGVKWIGDENKEIGNDYKRWVFLVRVGGFSY